MGKKLERCVADVKGDPDVDNAWAVCTNALKHAKAKVYRNDRTREKPKK